MAAAGMLLASCASDDGVSGGGVDSASFGTVGYIGFSIQLPNATTPSLPTRSNDDYNDGDATEYAVKTGKVLFFKGATEETATFIQAQNIINPTDGWNTDSSDKVTSTKTAVAKLDNVSFTSSENLYAYVVLNYGDTDLATNPSVGTTFKTYSEQTLAAAQTGGSLEGEISANGLLMTNAPISDKQGGSVDPTGAKITLAAVLDKNAIKPTSSEAEDAPAGCVYVERAAAKVTLEVTASATTIEMVDGSSNKLALSTSDIAWQIINTEKSFYNGRQANESAWLPYINTEATNANSKYRFVSNDLFSPAVGTGSHTSAYRTYFAKDPAYTTDYDGSTDALTLDKPVAGDTWLTAYTAEESGKRAYVPENTFPTQYQTRRNTTQATIRVKFNGGTDFYTISNDALYYTKANAEAKVVADLLADYNVNQKMEAAATSLAGQSGVSGSVTGALTVEITGTDAGVVEYTVTPSFTDEASNSYALSNITDTDVSGAVTTAINTAKADYAVTLYKDGYSYYNVRIKHFGEVETPWSSTGPYVTKPGTTTEQIYKISDTNYGDKWFLGRYGIVRDNWYKLSIDGITKLGSATPPTVKGDPTPDDEIEQEYYISAHVHILPWVIRNQSINF
mgnify:CR=1 FL=1